MEVVKLRNKPAIDPDLIDVADSLMKKVMSGEVDGIAWVASYADDRTCSTERAGKTGPTLIGALSLLLHRVTHLVADRP